MQRGSARGTAEFLTGLMEPNEKAALMLRAQLESEETEDSQKPTDQKS
jgi:hypothetical protein